MRKAIFIEKTMVAGVKKDRWECPFCRDKGVPECRFNLSPDKRGTNHKCKRCGMLLEINPY